MEEPPIGSVSGSFACGFLLKNINLLIYNNRNMFYTKGITLFYKAEAML